MGLGFGIVVFALGILISVCLHEAGHMGTAKAFGMKVTRYFVGFGPTLWSFRRGETEYGVKALPLGGFVKIVGMTPQDDDVAPEDEPRAMWRQAVWKRTIVMASGSITHFILGFILLWITVSFVGVTNPKWEKFLTANDTTLNASPPYVQVQPCVATSASATCDPNLAPAKQAGLRNGDEITAINGTQVSNYGQLVVAVRTVDPDSPNAKVTYVRDGQTHTTTVTLVRVTKAPINAPNSAPVQTWAIGIGPSLPASVPQTVTYGPIDGIAHAGTMAGTTFVGIGSALKHLPAKVPGLVD